MRIDEFSVSLMLQGDEQANLEEK